jgi:very-short-patch-repair endonuclease
MDLAREQWGAFRLDQALALGLSKDSVHRLVRKGEWVRIFTGIFATGLDLAGWQQRAMAACLWAREGVAASHECSAALWELDGIVPGTVEVLRLHKKHSPGPGVVVHSTTRRFAIQSRYGIPVTSATRTLIDLAGVLDEPTLELALESALRRRLTSLLRLQRGLDEEGGHGRPGSDKLGALLGHYGRSTVPTESNLEAKVLQILRRNGFPQPARQYVVRGEDGFAARIDFAYPQAMVAIEAEGYRWHSGREAWARDRVRTTRLASLGWRILYVTPMEAELGAPDLVRGLRNYLGPGTFPL